ncbi:2Fe-2S iron-sulfur cluster-binding protein [Magnetospirillum sp. SS-4]|uniref:2Fe-2S iron-sulfur cluster-binding protein n=1 Tax=Magnetospirillum sp. SS-4 TaxID=2681465 RepID=UPI0013832A38|nr:2Fe-2S iron-sulfur cluster-binding protein [Magnetospirillum sp. SS-4]CAA7623655.1 Ferredoxin-5 [Magnetospirillum sp. SS-4]
MANVTFSAPTLDKDITVYAVAGDNKTLLGVARQHGIPIPCQCQDGECGSCLIKVTVLGDNAPMAIHLTDKEKLTLSVNGKLTKAQLDNTETNDMPPPYRLACQYIVRGEDILVEFSGEPGVEIDLRR